MAQTILDEPLIAEMIERIGVIGVVELVVKVCYDKARDGDIGDPDNEAFYFQRDGERLEEVVGELYRKD
jgi:hypothetical protein